MASLSRNRSLWLVLLLILIAAIWWQALSRQGRPAAETGPMPAVSVANIAVTPLPGFLPPEAREVIANIRRGGPFPYRQDGSTFGNREGRLPAKARGYYREYTVDTPGLNHRGARRIVTGGDPPQVWYYTSDHYDSFRSFTLPPSIAN
ncbi:MAG: ribonuclease [Xanthomonadaceae bacterium]|jgi:guanyl-specific ribonuclease Sa|nr:ribonuclease [Xanthomonadaceae bacterium]